MYTTVRTKQFQKAFARILKKGLSHKVKKKLEAAVLTLARGERLPLTYRDHALQGDMSSFRECHISGDLLLIYSKHEDVLILELITIGTHAQLF